MTEATQDPIKVVVAMDFSDEIMAQLRDVSPRLEIERHYPDVPESVWEETEVLYTMRHFPDPERAPRLRWIQLHYAGMERVITKPIVQQANDVEVTSASGIHSTHMAEFCLTMMLAFMYQLPRMMKQKAQAEWGDKPYDVFNPHGLRGLTVGIVGYGSIGRELARLAHNMGMTILASKRDLLGGMEDTGYALEGTGDPEGDLPERMYPPEAIASMASECDFLVLTVPLTEKSRHMVNEDVFNAMKPTAYLINVARGGVVDEDALISAIAAEEIAGAALDVFEEEPLPPSSPLWNLDNIIISPHISGNATNYHERTAELFITNLHRYVENRPLLNALNRDEGY